jgi:hypothetical protein
MEPVSSHKITDADHETTSNHETIPGLQ